MGRQRYTLQLTRKQQAYLADFVSSETLSKQQRNRALVLQHWLANHSAQESAETLGLSIDRVYSMRRAFTQQGFRGYLHEVPRCGAPNKLTPELELLLRKLTQGQGPAKGKRWTLALLAQRIVELGHTDRICTLTVHKALKRIRTTAPAPQRTALSQAA
ncbi:helix-turn-helix domain-containing protein [Hymenobacter latericus]|uniref:helix-turn-helix domain-containing protein n=1 Tax=Hymenobacter sp. YIM 151858-1 TaxID=2987688 RepID=UPI0022273BC7|nr:helix-turn-helix domain-containing protein [Hymenobacter sp. YIM 151858-1]UYZ59667.1 helix-turn-helix domain-containing protein [Hymenobacter sp. YIM 151858-1]